MKEKNLQQNSDNTTESIFKFDLIKEIKPSKVDCSEEGGGDENLFCIVAKGGGFEVHDLGVDVPAEDFLKAVEEIKPQIVGFSALITTAFEPMKKVVDLLTEKGLREHIKVIVGGGVTTETVLKYVGADGQTIDAVEGLEICKKLVSHQE